MDNVNQWGQFILAAALSSLRRLASLPLTRADLHNYSVLWNVRENSENLICAETFFCFFSFPWAVTKESASSGVTFPRSGPDGFICYSRGLKGRTDHLTVQLPPISFLSECKWGFCTGTHMHAACTAHTHTHRDTRCLQRSPYGSS